MRALITCVSLGIVMLSSVFTGGPCMAEVTDRHREVVQEVADRLLAVMEKPEGWEAWPPEVTVVDPGFANAFASFREENGVEIPMVEITVTTIEDIAKFEPDVLAYTIGHELGHLHFRHSHTRIDLAEKFGDKLTTIRMACGREHELEADLFGMQLALKAGYSRQGLLKDLQAWRELTPPYCRFEGLAVVHPPWEERAAFLLRGENQEALWQSLGSFQTGVMFLENQHYNLAQLCFHNVTTEFPECYEAWANMGYAYLMQYCDALDAEDLRTLDVGHLVVGGFYRRPDSLEPDVKRGGGDPELWFEAVGAFREALRLQERLQLSDELLMVKANLAVAYLVHPNGKDVGQAERWFDEVFTSLKDPEKAKQLDPLVHASILINSGAARGFDSDLIASTLTLIAKARTGRNNASAVAAMEAALQFNQARALSVSGDKTEETSALALYEKYLDGMTAASSWWPIAYQEYVKLAQATGATPKAEQDFRQPGIADWRTLTGVTLEDGTIIGLSQKLSEVLEAIGPADVEVPVIEGTNLKFYKYNKLGLSILASREVLAVVLESSAAPKITLRRPDLGGETAEVGLGMSRGALEDLLGSDWDVELTSLFELDEIHQLYRDLGLAARFKDGAVSELVVSVVPLAD
ncbi:MAG: hypothetical protein R3C56_30315 [Pirellulaceae bacterium]